MKIAWPIQGPLQTWAPSLCVDPSGYQCSAVGSAKTCSVQCVIIPNIPIRDGLLSHTLLTFTNVGECLTVAKASSIQTFCWFCCCAWTVPIPADGVWAGAVCVCVPNPGRDERSCRWDSYRCAGTAPVILSNCSPHTTGSPLPVFWVLCELSGLMTHFGFWPIV